MSEFPNLTGVATADLVEKIGGGNFKASYINWARTMNLLRDSAPGWLPELVPNPDGNILHLAPQGGYLLIRFRHADGTVTPEVPQAIMDTRNNAIPADKITARDITDTHVRGTCKAAALVFGLASELWAKMPLESGYAEQPPETVTEAQAATIRDMIEATNSDTAKFCAAFGVGGVDALPAGKYDAAVAALNRKAKQAA